jgi:two-component system, chemotaxis family, chemotaxis protein CheY
MSKKALIVDDSATMRQLESLYLKQLGFDVEQAADASLGLSQLRSDHQLVISDLNMPGMNGLEFTKAVRTGTLNPHIPIVMISTEGSENFQESAKKAGVSAWIQKPFSLENLQKVINRLLPDGDG